MDRVSHAIAIWTLVLVAVTAVASVPAMFREIIDFMASKRRTRLRGIFDKSGATLPLTFDALLEKTRFHESTLRASLYDLRARGEVQLTGNDCWVKTVEPFRARQRG